MLLKILATLIVISVFMLLWHRNGLRRLTRDYACMEPFEGALVECILVFTVPSNKAAFLVPRETGRELLKKAGRTAKE
jgi:hypothetical protein